MGEVVDFKSFSNNSAGWNVRVVMVDGEPWFVATDVCKALGIGNPTDAIKRLDDDERTLVSIEGASNGLPVNVVSEPGLYKLIMSSRKPEAKPFQRWVVHEVLPEIRKTGSYNSSSQARMPTYHIPQGFIEAMEYAIALAKANTKLQEKVDELEPKASQFDLLMSGKNAVTINEFVKAFGHGWGRNKLFAWMRAKGLLMKNGSNLPYQRYVDAGYMTVREVTKEHGEKGTFVHSQPMITPKGMDWLAKMLLSEGQIIQFPNKGRQLQ